MSIATTAESRFWTYALIDSIFESLFRGRRFDFTVQGFPVIYAVWKETVCISLGFGYMGSRDILTENAGSFAWDMLKKICWSKPIKNLVIKSVPEPRKLSYLSFP